MDMFSSLITHTSFDIATYAICTVASLLLGMLIAWVYTYKTRYSQSFVLSLILLPATVQIVIMLVNGNIGTGVAVAGAFSLVRFRSLPGNAKDIVLIFLSMAIGLATGTGYIGVAALFAIIVSIMLLLISHFKIGEPANNERELCITIPESMDYSDVFDSIFNEFTEIAELIEVKTSNMGSLFKLRYQIKLKNPKEEKKFIDELRCRNGNLEIRCGRIAMLQQL